MPIVPPSDIEQSIDNLKLERDAIVLYDALADILRDPRRAAAFRAFGSWRSGSPRRR